MSTQTALLKVMSDAARKAARGLNRDFGELSELQVSRKAPADFVSAADLKAEQAVFEALEKARPGYSFLGEERGLIEGTDKTHTWIVDPLDGTTNFLHAIPHFAINIALQREGAIVAAVTYNPVTNELFWAEKGKGCFVNDKRLRVAGRKHLDESVLGTGIPFLGHGQHARFLKELHQISQRVAGVRRFGAASLDLAYVAAGRLDGFWERDLKPWDMAAGLLMIQEAGGKVTDMDGGEDMLTNGSICTANLELHPLMLDKLKAAG
ncbi:MAG: inositol monophosphatase family protein [Pseudomonadota bacterium]|uniref:inositol monophosphatase family protein n=1 Tax=unclassified Phenylobacterium TaxID=2640670 RepID=UPI0006F4E2C7|nr:MULTISPECIES: inositol monophosphatase family protein [unclassified Phenylobacterium]KRB50509.1 inositol monophosphatase [Phenylobacterium sp. Root700]MBT9472876.1 inositol monophosphatase [Phenylobacterium sp.]